MSNELFKEVLADVKDLTRIAEENAVYAVTEAVTPKIRELIESRLVEASSHKKTVNEILQNEMYVFDEKTVKKVAPIVEITNLSEEYTLDTIISEISKNVKSILETKGTKDFNYDRLDMAVSSVENMYGYVRETLKDKKRRAVLEEQLENLYKEMKESIKETEMLKLNEEDLSLKLSGLPELEDEDLENIEVELVADDSEEGDEGEEVDLEVSDDEGGDEEFDLSGFEGDGEEEEEDEEENPFEESVVYEIDESLFAKELKRMNEAHSAVDNSALDDFGGGADDGDPWLDSDLPDVPGTKSSGPKNVKEAEELDEEDVEEEGCSSKKEVSEKLRIEKNILSNITRRLKTIKEQYAKATNSASKMRLKKAYERNSVRLNESKKRAKVLIESLSRSNNERGQKAEKNSALVNTLRKQLHESNLVNQKLVQANKVLQERSLSNSQKKKIIEALDKANSLSEIKAINEKVRKIVKRGGSAMNESVTRTSSGLASAPMRSSGTSDKNVMNEGLGVERWQTLAGLKD